MSSTSLSWIGSASPRTASSPSAVSDMGVLARRPRHASRSRSRYGPSPFRAVTLPTYGRAAASRQRPPRQPGQFGPRNCRGNGPYLGPPAARSVIRMTNDVESLPGQLLSWAARAVAPSARVISATGMKEGGNPWLLRLATADGTREAVLKTGDAAADQD